MKNSNVVNFPRSGPKATRYSPGVKGTMEWLKVRNPRLYAESQRFFKAPNLAGLGITGDAAEAGIAANTAAPAKPSVVDRIRDLVLAAGQTYLTAEQLKAQKKLLDMNLARAQQNLPPLDYDLTKYGFAGPQLGLNVGADTQKFLMIGLVAAGAIYLLGKVAK
jgi:hypothetical protein